MRFYPVVMKMFPLFIYNAWNKSRTVQKSHISGMGNKLPIINRKMFIITKSNEQFLNAPHVVVEAVTL